MADPALPFIVTLNLFQGPSLGISRSYWVKTQLTGKLSARPSAPGEAARWTLNRVQGDDEGEGRPMHAPDFP